MKYSICLILILISQLSKKGFKIIVIKLTFILRIANLSENLLTSIDEAKNNKIIGESATDKNHQIINLFGPNFEISTKFQTPTKLFKPSQHFI